MEYRTLGKTGLRISRMGFGGIPIQRIDAAGTKVLIRQLLDAGVNYIDTARGYTVSESYLGEALEGIREHFVLATKSMARTMDAMAKDIDISLANLRTDYIDLYQVHNPSPADLEKVIAPGGALEAMLAAKAAGKIGHLGITAHSLEVFRRALELPWVETIMFPYNIVETLAGGAIEDATLALRFVCADPDVTVVIPGMAEPAELAQNLAAVCDTAPLTQQELAAMEQIRKDLGTHFCRRCNYCAPCTAGISIPGVFLMEGYYSRYGLQDWAKARYDAMAKKASDCIECGVCETRCPYQLPIRQMLKAAAEKFGKYNTGVLQKSNTPKIVYLSRLTVIFRYI